MPILEHVQNSINWLQAANFILYFVRFFRHSCRLCLQNLPRLKQNFLAFAQSWKFEQALRKYHSLRDSAIGAETQAKIAELEMLYESEKKELALQKSQKELINAKQSIWNRTIVAAFALLFLFILGFIALKIKKDRIRKTKFHEVQQRIFYQDLKLKELEQAQLAERFANRHKDLTDLALEITRKNDFVEILLQKIEALSANFQPSQLSELYSLQQFILSHQQLDVQKAVF